MRILKTALLVLLVATTTIFAQMGPPQDGQRGPHGQFLHCLRILNLTDAQQTSITAILEAAAPQLQALHQELATDMTALKAALDAATPDACAIGALALEVEADRDAIQAKRDEVRTAILAVLTPEQQQRFAGCLDGQGPPPGQGPGNGNGNGNGNGGGRGGH